MNSQLERAINLAAKTGDKIIVVDEFNDRSSVVMSLDDYEMLLKGRNKGGNSVRNLTEEELLDKINHDIISWKDANSDRNFSSEISGFNDWENEDEDDDEIDTDIFPDFTAPNFKDNENIISEPDEESSSAFATDDDPELVPEEITPEEPVIEKVAESVAAESKVDEDQNVYYYHEPESDKTEPEKEESGFTSIKDELKNKKHWAIPSEVKDKAEDVKK